ncbi:hypothetical protein V8D89_012199 [Ganoderma adspersum]
MSEDVQEWGRAVSAFLVVNNDGHRALAQYYRQKGLPNWNSSDTSLYDSHMAVCEHSLDFYILKELDKNELMLHYALVGIFSDTVEKRGMLENLDTVLLYLNDTIDYRPRIVINEQTIRTAKEDMQQRIGQF